MNEYMVPDGYADFGEEMFAGAVGGSLLGVFLVVYFLILFLAMAFSVLTYVLHSLGLYAIANRRGIANAWLAWLPLGNIWILGNISDQYQYVAKGKIKNRRKIMLGLSIGLFAVYFLWLIGMIVSAVAGGELAAIVGMIGGTFFLMIAAIVLTVLEYMAYYDLFQSCQPSNSVLYLVLSVLFNVTLPFFVFFIRKKDLGMPPRKQTLQALVDDRMQTPEAPAEEIVEEPAEVKEETTEE